MEVLQLNDVGAIRVLRNIHETNKRGGSVKWNAGKVS